ncbi:hypothetical protein Btru_061128 [Bulinus truncatus]|nr:hypothetical protein Btru_061128 [Bulinus truncatus]
MQAHCSNLTYSDFPRGCRSANIMDVVKYFTMAFLITASLTTAGGSVIKRSEIVDGTEWQGRQLPNNGTIRLTFT